MALKFCFNRRFKLKGMNKLLAIDANSFDAYSGIGTVYVAKGQDLYSDANLIPVKQKAKYDADKDTITVDMGDGDMVFVRK